MNNLFVAHLRTHDKKEQTVSEHLMDTALIAGCLAEKLGIPKAGELLGLLHDFGKYSRQFQAYIQSATGILNPDADDEYVDAAALRGRIDHSSAGAQWIWENFRRYGQQGELVGQILALCLASHHGAGLIDCLKTDGDNGFVARIRKGDAKTHLQECMASVDPEVLKKLNLLATPTLIQECSQQISTLVGQGKHPVVEHFNIGLWARFLFSCLVDADRINSADFENPSNEEARLKGRINWQVAIDRLERKLANLPIRHDIDSIRRSISDRCKERAVGPQGIYTLTVPTGGGKTYSSIRYALHHAKEHKLERIVYIIPYTSIIEQNAQAIRDLLEANGDQFPWVLEHHSNLEPEKLTWRDKLIAENWDAPIVFTTMVQFLDTLFSGGTRGARRMHQLAKSVLIFDEIQTLPIRCVHIFCNAINFLVAHAGTTAVLCTATQPLLDKLKSPEKGQLNIPKENELVEDVAVLFDQLKRVTIINKVRLDGGWSEPELAELAVAEYEQKGSCLVVVNTKKWAQQLYEACKCRVIQKNLFHLSTSLCPAHRKEILARVRQRLDDELPVLCISTQLIEAGVDVDFASVIRFLAGLDSIAQAAGRCNRNKKWEQSSVYVVNPDQETIDQLDDIKEGRDISLRVLSEKKDADLLDPEVMKLFFSYYFYSRAAEMDYPVSPRQAGRQDSLLSLLSDNRRNIARTKPLQLRQSFATAGKIFHAIDAPTQAVIVPYEEGKEIIAGLCAEFEPAKAYQLLKRAQKYSVNVFPNVMQKLKEVQAVRPVQKGEEIYYLDERYYSRDFGLSTEEVSPMEFQNA